MPLNIKQLTLAVLARVRANALDEVPVSDGTNSGGLYRSLYISYIGDGMGAVGANEPYAAAVHNGRRALTIKPNVQKNPPRGKRDLKGLSKNAYEPRARLMFKIGGKTVFAKEVKQPARPANQFLYRAVATTESEGYGFLLPSLKKEVEEDVAKNLISKIKLEIVV